MGFRDCQSVENLKKKSRNIIVLGRGSVYAKNLIRSANEEIGIINAEDLVEFLDKFGRRLFIDDLIDRLFGKEYKRWEIDFQLLYSGYLLFHKDQKGFEKAVKECRNKEEFLMVYGVS